MARSFGEVVREGRERRRMTPKALADQISRTPSYVSRLETDLIKTPPPDVVAGVSRALGLDETMLVRLIGYLSTVPEGEERAALIIREDDPRYEVARILTGVADGDLAAIKYVAERLRERN